MDKNQYKLKIISGPVENLLKVLNEDYSAGTLINCESPSDFEILRKSFEFDSTTILLHPESLQLIF